MLIVLISVLLKLGSNNNKICNNELIRTIKSDTSKTNYDVAGDKYTGIMVLEKSQFSNETGELAN